MFFDRRVVAKRLCVVVAELGPKQIPVVLAGFRNRFPRFRVLKLSATFCRLYFSKEANIGFSRLYTDLDSHVGHELPQLYPPTAVHVHELQQVTHIIICGEQAWKKVEFLNRQIIGAGHATII